MRTLVPSDLAFVADALLILVGQDEEAPFRLEGDFMGRERKLAARAILDSHDALECIAAKAGGSTFADECVAVMIGCGLTIRQRQVFDLFLSGVTFTEIGAVLHVSRQGAMNVFAQGLKKVCRAVLSCPYTGLGDCYREDLRRRGMSHSARLSLSARRVPAHRIRSDY